MPSFLLAVGFQDSVEQERHFSSEADSDMKTQIEGSGKFFWS